jgi:hypothetical protein
MDIVNYRGRLQEGDVFVTDSQFMLGRSGRVSASGQFGSTSKFSLAWNELDVTRFLPTDWKSRLSGSLTGSCDITPASKDRAGRTEWYATGNVKLTNGLLQKLPLLDQLASFTGDLLFAGLKLDEISAKFECSPSSLVLTNFLLESKGLLRVESDRIVSNGSLSGTLRVGVGTQTMRWLPAARDRIFTTPRDGYLWTEMTVEGSPSDLRENLSARLLGAMKNAAVQTGIKTGSDLLKTAPLPDPAKQGINGLMNTFLPLMK